MPNRERVEKRREAERGPEPAPVLAPPAATVLALQRGYGNAHVSRMIARYAKPRSAAESVGAEPGQAEAMPPAPGERGELELGKKGYTLQLLKAVPEAAGETFGLYKDLHLEPVKVTFGTLDGKTLPKVSKQLRDAKDKAGDFFNTPSTTATWTRRAAEHQAKLDQLIGDRSRAQQLVQAHNAGVPRANHTFASLARLEAMQELLGIKTPQALASAVVRSLDEAQVIGQRAQLRKGVKQVTPPEAAEQVTVAAKELTGAQKQLSAAWLGVQQNLVADHATALAKTGEADQQRLTKINQHIAFARNVGKTIDVSMAVLSGGATMVEGGGSTPLKPSQLSDLKAEEQPDVRDRSGTAAAKQAGGAIIGATGITLPSDGPGCWRPPPRSTTPSSSRTSASGWPSSTSRSMPSGRTRRRSG